MIEPWVNELKSSLLSCCVASCLKVSVFCLFQADREKEAQKKRELEERLEQERLDEILKKTKEEEEARLEAEKRKQQQKVRECISRQCLCPQIRRE